MPLVSTRVPAPDRLPAISASMGRRGNFQHQPMPLVISPTSVMTSFTVHGPRLWPPFSVLFRCKAKLAWTALLIFGGVGAAYSEVNPETCGNTFHNTYGPFDYRSATKFQRNIVENAHFTTEVEVFLRGKTSNHVGADIAYTLSVLPNHHRALVATVRLTEKLGTDQPPKMRPIECYFASALRFAPSDLVVQGLYVDWLIRKKRTGEAEVRLDQLVAKAADNPNIHYTAGLLYLQLEKYDKALHQAHRAEELGWQQTELADKLRTKDQWRERPVPPRTP